MTYVFVSNDTILPYSRSTSRSTRRSKTGRRVVAGLLAGAVLAVPESSDATVVDINASRTAAGLTPVAEDSRLTSLAQQRAAQMAASGTLQHTPNLGGAVGSAVPGFSGAAENVGVSGSASNVHVLFVRSPSHHTNMLGNYNLAGVGAARGADGRVYVTQVFARIGGGPGAAVSRAGTGNRSVSRRVRRRRARVNLRRRRALARRRARARAAAARRRARAAAAQRRR